MWLLLQELIELHLSHSLHSMHPPSY